MATARKTVFVSYAHKDHKWVDELKVSLAPWIRNKRINLWDDSQIQFGDRWGPEIRKAIEEATVAILLVTKHFLASDFIMKQELPVLLERAQKKQIHLGWVAIGHAAVETTELPSYQALNDPVRPLGTLRRTQRDKAWIRIANVIADAVTLSTFASGLQMIDETMEPLEAALEGRPERTDREFRVQANYEPAQNQISFRGAHQIITAADLKHLPTEDRAFIADLEDSLHKNYEQWRETRKGLTGAGGLVDGEVENQLRKIANLICADLNTILDFLAKMHKGELDDHYARYRYICDTYRRA